MKGLLGFSLSKIAVISLALAAAIPILQAFAVGNYLPLITGFVVYAIAALGRLRPEMPLLLALLAALAVASQSKHRLEGFADAGEDVQEEANEEKKQEEEQPVESEVEPKKEAEQFKDVKKKARVAPPPNNGSRAELFELGKKYRLPSENEDGEFHVDAATTFMKAYKQLKPEQIAALTTDTQELIKVQKDLMNNLSNLKPLISDGKEIMSTFQKFFGSGEPIAN